MFTFFQRWLHRSAALLAALTLGSTDGAAQTPARLPNSITLSAEDLREIFQNDPFGLERFLGFQAGISFHSTGDLGAEDWIMIRGFGRDDSRIILVLVDGRPINQRTHTVDFGDLILTSIQSLTIHPGPIPARFGGYHAVIEISTRRQIDLTYAAASAGSQSSYGLAAGLLRSEGRHYFGAEIDLQTSEAQSGERFAYQLRAVPPGPASGRACQTPPPPGPPLCLPLAIDAITFSERDYRHLVAQLHYGALVSSDLDLTARLHQVHSRKSLGSERWIPRTYAPARLDPARQRPQIDARNRDFTTLTLAARPAPGSQLDFAANAYFTYESEELGTLGKQYYLGDQRRHRYGIDAGYRWVLSGRSALGLGAELSGVRGRIRNPLEVSFPWGVYERVRRQTYRGAHVELDHRPWPGANLHAGLRHNAQSNHGTGSRTSPVFAFEQSFAADTARVYAVRGENQRWIPPLELERYAAAGLSVPMERMEGFELGLRVTGFDDRFRLRSSAFRLDNRFSRFTPTGPMGLRGQTRGIETAVDLRPYERARGLLNLTRFETPRGDVQSPGDYRWLANAGLFVDVSRQWTVEAVARRLGRFRTGIDELAEAEALFLFGPPFLRVPGFEGYGRFRQGPATVVDLSTHWRPGAAPGSQIGLGVYNLTGRRYQTFPELPQWDLPNRMPGRLWQLSLSYTL